MSDIDWQQETAYGQAIRPAHASLKSVFVQLGGFLILRSASTAVRLEMSERMKEAQGTLTQARAILDRTSPPIRYVRTHARLKMAADGLGRVLNEVMIDRVSAASMVTLQTMLDRAYSAFRQASASELGLRTVDLNGSCCAVPAHACPQHDM